jgi:hypothetical protein
MKRVSQIWTCILCGFNSVVHKRGEEISWNFYVILFFLQASLHAGNKVHVSPPPYAVVPNCVTYRSALCNLFRWERKVVRSHSRNITYSGSSHSSSCRHGCWFSSSATARWSKCSKIFEVHMEMSMCAIVFWVMTPWEVDINVLDDYSSSDTLEPSHRNKTAPKLQSTNVHFSQFWTALNVRALRLHSLKNLELGKQIEDEGYVKIQHTYTTILQRIFYIVTIWLFCTMWTVHKTGQFGFMRYYFGLVPWSLSLVGRITYEWWVWYYNINIWGTNLCILLIYVH